MSYLSKVRIVTTYDAYNELFTTLSENELLHKYLDIYERPEFCNFVMFGWNSVKWYEGHSDVDEIMNALNAFKDRGIPYQFIRTREEFDDIEKYENKPEKLPFRFEPEISIRYPTLFIHTF